MLTPTDVENKVFKKTKIGGYDIKDVEDFLEKLIVDYEQVFKNVTELRDRCDNLQESVKYYKSLEQGIEQSINNAKTEAENIKERALIESQELREKKEKEFENRKTELDLELRQIECEIEQKKKEMQIYKIKVKSMLEAQMKILDEE